MPVQTIRSATARHAAAQLATTLVLARCRAGHEAFEHLPALQSRCDWLVATSYGLSDWLLEGGFAGEEIRLARAETVKTNVKTAALGRRFLVPTEDIDEES